ncbi:MAG: type II secretion system protein [Fimbriimonadaceae bacterium]|nr:type II secretion system protein [Fimbriimonadaceae bacterium]
MKVKKAFTLMEILVVIAILCILAGLLMPVFQRSKFSAEGTVCISNQGHVVRAVELYLIDFDGAYPPAVDSHVKPFCSNISDNLRLCSEALPLRNFIDPYTKTDGLYHCLLDRGLRVVDFFQGPIQELPTSFAGTGTSYWYNEVLSLTGATISSIRNPSSAAIVNDRTGAWHADRPINTDSTQNVDYTRLYRGYRYVTGFADGHVKSITPRQLNAAKGAVIGDIDWLLNIRLP